ncbi:MAG: PSD1 and planctomycete cytochrome C domain-containing protein [Verrucomicrobiota bacterium]|nr:PSD1 and planctomycete cytochrome C domain-containing protein [Verrucomicrobiota bacterium]
MSLRVTKFFSTAPVVTILALSPIAFSAGSLPPAVERKVDFKQEIQPIFSERCYDCHGSKKQESGFRLDQKSAAMKGGQTGLAIVPGKSAESILIQAVAGVHEELARMPKRREPLSPEQIGLLRGWIDQGAEWPETNEQQESGSGEHWAFKAPVKPKFPDLKENSEVQNPIDHFIIAKLEKEGLKLSPRADKITLLRRLSLDLIGLPPSIEEVDAFLADQSADAYRKQVERLLASPHYGEKWGRHWLDAARYADSDGFEKDKSRNVWFYRDYVINAFNRDLPYNQFIIEQMAGDQLSNATQDQIVATGFLRNSMINEEGGVDPEQFRMEAMFDRMDAIGKTFLGLTIQCAQCHNHKYDPLKQEEYYRMFAFINNDHEPMRVVYTAQEQMQRESVLRQMNEIEEDLRHRHPDWEEKMAQWEEGLCRQPDWKVLNLSVEDISTGGQKYLPQKDGSFLAQSYAPTKHTVRMMVTNDLTKITAFRLELLPDANLPANGPGRSFKGTAALTEFKVEAADAKNPTRKSEVKIKAASADFNQPERELEPNFDDKSGKQRKTGPVQFAIDSNQDTAWGIDAGPGRRNQARKAVFLCETNAAYPEGTILTFQLAQNHGGWNSDDHMNNNLGRFRLSVTSADEPAADPLPKTVRDLLSIPRGERSPAQKAIIFSYWRTTVEDWKNENDRIEALWKQYPEGQTALTLMTREEQRDTHLLRRGDFLKPGKVVGAGVPAFLHQLPENAPPTRLTFARWLADEKSPTTARVFVNRLWQSYFGIGLVSTSEDFGTQSETPSHPELLDWLATEFMERKWSIKEMHRLIVHSATYQQSSKVTEELYARDPYNRLVARGPRFRVDGEIVRDIALKTSGLLSEKVGGRSVMPPAPQFLFGPPNSYAPFTWTEETGEDRYRRALYTFRRRSTPYPMLQTFDVPNGDFSCVKRTRSNTPLQALMTLNETLSMECAQALARVVLQHGGNNDEERIEYAFRRTLSRKASQEEKEELLKLLERQRERIQQGWVNPSELATGKSEVPKNLPPNATPTQLAAYTVISRVLLNLDETITKE